MIKPTPLKIRSQDEKGGQVGQVWRVTALRALESHIVRHLVPSVSAMEVNPTPTKMMKNWEE